MLAVIADAVSGPTPLTTLNASGRLILSCQRPQLPFVVLDARI
jgi:hypothetical protein